MINNYNDPRVTLKQVYKLSVAGQTPLLGACIIGPHYIVKKYLDLEESLKLGDYNEGTPFKETLRLAPYLKTVDKDSIKIYARDAYIILEEIAIANSNVVISGNEIKVSPDDVRYLNIGDLIVVETLMEALEKYYKVRVIKLVASSKDRPVDTIIVSNSILLDENLNPTKLQFIKKTSGYLDEACVSFDSVTNSIILNSAVEMPVLLLSLTKMCRVIKGALYCLYRVRSTEYTKNYGFIAGASSVLDVLGKVSALNPLSIAVSAALANAQDNFVFFIAVDVDLNDTLDDIVKAYNTAFDYVSLVLGCYGIVPCTSNKAVLKNLLSLVNAKSSLEIPYFKYLYGSMDIPKEDILVRGASIKEISSTNLADKTVMNITLKEGSLSGVSKELIDADVYVNQRYLGSIKATNYIDKISVSVATGVDTSYIAQNDLCSILVQVKKAYLAVSLMILNKPYSDKRGAIVVADGARFNGLLVPNYIVAAAVAGLRSAKLAQAPLSNVAITGISVDNTLGIPVSESKRLGANGFWRVGMSSDGVCITKRQLTSAAEGDANYDLQSIVCVVDAVCLMLKTVGKSYVGNSNISPSLLALLRADITYMLNSFTTTYDEYVGPMLLNALLLELKQDLLDKSRILASISGLPPKPFNLFSITFYMN